MADSKHKVKGVEESAYHINCSRVVSENFEKLRHDRESSDIILQVGSKRGSNCYYTHKLILSNASAVFRQMFNGKWKESEEKRATLNETKKCQEVFPIFLDFIYGGKKGAILLNADNVVPLVTLADKYEVTALKDLCCKFAETLIDGNVRRALSWLKIAEDLKLTPVSDRCYDVICWNLKQAFMILGEFDLDLTTKQMLAILEREDVVVETEFDVFMAVEKWLTSFYVQELLRDGTGLIQILQHIEFRNMTTDELKKSKNIKYGQIVEGRWRSRSFRRVHFRCYRTSVF
ncbi:BTB/POZ domain-containing protein 17-like [Amphiura filiformis]|uniref:BTB/POZ domain-containing protein 17-like n=1 Tax=Amphiura filiformis TaxID=82378 RepID=UPI003B20FC12